MYRILSIFGACPLPLVNCFCCLLFSRNIHGLADMDNKDQENYLPPLPWCFWRAILPQLLYKIPHLNVPQSTSTSSSTVEVLVGPRRFLSTTIPVSCIFSSMWRHHCAQLANQTFFPRRVVASAFSQQQGTWNAGQPVPHRVMFSFYSNK